MNEDEIATRFVNELKQLSNEPTIRLAISPLMVWQIICQLQLALRHPENTGIASEETRRFVDTLVDEIPLSNSLKELFSMGWNPEHDHVIESKPELKIRETHNVVAIYGMNEDGTCAERPIAEFFRPQDWGDKDRWHYEFFRLEWISNGYKYINNCHCYTDIKNPECGYPILFAQCVATILYPGKPPQLCGREFLDEHDFWCEEWGE
ncbi:MAG: hypothetical protein RMY35_035390, partial [Nostoc sp. DedSLP01]